MNTVASDISIDDLVAALEAKQDELSPDHKRRLSVIALVEEKVRPDVKGALSGTGEPAPAGQPDTVQNKSTLSPEQMQELLAALEVRFNNHPRHYENLEALPRLKQGVTFTEVRVCLENDPALAKKVYTMLKRDGDPDVYSRYGRSFLFFESVQDTTAASRNCVYGKVQAGWLRKNRPSERFNGSVEEQREAMGDVGVTTQQMWYDLQKLGPFTDNSWEWTDSDDINDDTPTGNARGADRSGGRPYVDVYRARNHGPDRGWRAVAKGSEA